MASHGGEGGAGIAGRRRAGRRALAAGLALVIAALTGCSGRSGPPPSGGTSVPAAAAGAQAPPGAVVYENQEYGFRFLLPSTWAGYTVVTERWEGFAQGPQGDRAVESGPLIRIRHPGWKPDRPREDIPILVFTVAQWEALQRGEYQVSAAPVGPAELGRNSRFVFALPPRYNYAQLEGFEEVETILGQRPLQAGP